MMGERREARHTWWDIRAAICFDINQHNVHQHQTLTTARNRLLQWIKRSGRETLIISITIDYYPLSADTLWRENYSSHCFRHPNLIDSTFTATSCRTNYRWDRSTINDQLKFLWRIGIHNDCRNICTGNIWINRQLFIF